MPFRDRLWIAIEGAATFIAVTGGVCIVILVAGGTQ